MQTICGREAFPLRSQLPWRWQAADKASKAIPDLLDRPVRRAIKAHRGKTDRRARRGRLGRKVNKARLVRPFAWCVRPARRQETAESHAARTRFCWPLPAAPLG